MKEENHSSKKKIISEEIESLLKTRKTRNNTEIEKLRASIYELNRKYQEAIDLEKKMKKKELIYSFSYSIPVLDFSKILFIKQIFDLTNIMKVTKVMFPTQWDKNEFSFGDIVETFHEDIKECETKVQKLGVYINTGWEIFTLLLYLSRKSISDFVKSKFSRSKSKEKPKSKIE